MLRQTNIINQVSPFFQWKHFYANIRYIQFIIYLTLTLILSAQAGVVSWEESSGQQYDSPGGFQLGGVLRLRYHYVGRCCKRYRYIHTRANLTIISYTYRRTHLFAGHRNFSDPGDEEENRAGHAALSRGG